MSTSKLQRKVGEILYKKYPNMEILENSRPEWLIGPKGERLELDFYIPEIDIAIEVQGAQHYTFIEYFHQDINGFKDQVSRDESKRKTCERAGLNLMEIADNHDLEDALTQIETAAKKVVGIYGNRYAVFEAMINVARKALTGKKLYQQRSKLYRLSREGGIPIMHIEIALGLRNKPKKHLYRLFLDATLAVRKPIKKNGVTPKASVRNGLEKAGRIVVRNGIPIEDARIVFEGLTGTPLEMALNAYERKRAESANKE